MVMGTNWLAILRQLIGVEMQPMNGTPHPVTTSPEERARIDEEIEKTRVELRMLLAQASLDEMRTRDQQGHAP